MRSKIFITAFALVLCARSAVFAQPPASPDPVGDALIPPQIIMEHQDSLKLTDAQRNAIQSDAQIAQEHFMSEQWRLAAASEKLVALLKQSHIDQSKALAQLDSVLDLERAIKRTQLTLMIEVKNVLTPDQQSMARQFNSGAPK